MRFHVTTKTRPLFWFMAACFALAASNLSSAAQCIDYEDHMRMVEFVPLAPLGRGIDIVQDVVYIASRASEYGLTTARLTPGGSVEVLATIATPDDAEDVEVVGNLAYLACRGSGLAIFDVSDPEAPRMLGTVDTEDSATSVWVSGDLAYVADAYGGLKVVDCSVPESPRIIGEYGTDWRFLDVVVEGQLAYLAEVSGYGKPDRGLQIVDVSDPGEPSFVGELVTEGSAVRLDVDSGIVFVGDLNGGLKVIDASDPANPALVGWHQDSGAVRAIAARDGVVYCGAAEGLTTVSRTELPWMPRLGSVASGFGFWDLEVVGDRCIGLGETGGLAVIDIGSVVSPAAFTSWTNQTTSHLVAEGEYVYTFGGTFSLMLHDGATPHESTPTGWVTGFLPPLKGAAVVGDLAMAAAGDSGVLVFDVANKEHPTRLEDVIVAQGRAEAMACAGQTCAVGTQNGIQLYDLSSGEFGHELGSLAYPLEPTLREMVIGGGFVFVGVPTDRIEVFDIRNEWAPGHVATIPQETGGSQLAWHDGLLYVGSTYSDSLLIFEVHDPSAIRRVGAIELSDDVRDVAVSSGVAYVAGHSAGMQLIDVSDPSMPKYHGSIDLGEHCWRVAVNEHAVWVAGENNVFTFPLQCGLTVPVMLRSLEATREGRAVRLRWRVSEPSARDDFRVWASVGGQYRSIEVGEGQDGDFFAVDHGIAPGYSGAVDYAIEMLVEGRWVHLASTEVPISRRLSRPRLIGAAPNPFNPSTTIEFEMPATAEASVVVYGVDGRRVRTLQRSVFRAGRHELHWDGRDDSGRRVASGSYFLRLESEAGHDSHRVLMVK